MMKKALKTLEKGFFYENQAKVFLQENGYEILAQNYRFGKGEIDIIAQKAGWLVFVEVRYRKNANFGYPEQTISEKKKTLLRQTAENFIFEKNWQGNIRFDVIAITEKGNIEHFQDCF
jgi:putative endonuclease